MHPCEDDIVCKCTTEENKVPYFNAPVYLENKEQIGKVDEIFGQLRDFVSFLLSLLQSLRGPLIHNWSNPGDQTEPNLHRDVLCLLLFEVMYKHYRQTFQFLLHQSVQLMGIKCHISVSKCLNLLVQYFSVKLSENMKASSFKKMQKV